MDRAAEMMAGDRGLRQMLMFAANGHDRTPLPVPELTAEEFATVMRTSPLGRHLSANKQNSVKPQGYGKVVK